MIYDNGNDSNKQYINIKQHTLKHSYLDLQLPRVDQGPFRRKVNGLTASHFVKCENGMLKCVKVST